MNDYLPADVWTHGLDDEAEGVRVMRSVDEPDAFVLQIRSGEGRVFNARVSPQLLADLHRQAASS